MFDDDDELHLQDGWLEKGVKPHLQPEPLSETLTIANLCTVWAGLEAVHILSLRIIE